MRKTALACTLALAIPLGVTSRAAADDVEKWADHTGDLSFVFGFEKGEQEARWSGRPMMVFFTATW